MRGDDSDDDHNDHNDDGICDVVDVYDDDDNDDKNKKLCQEIQIHQDPSPLSTMLCSTQLSIYIGVKL